MNKHTPLSTARILAGSFLLTIVFATGVSAQDNEATFLAGTGRAAGSGAADSGSVIGIGYSRWLAERWTADLGLETLRIDSQNSFDTASVATAFHFRPRSKSSWSPFVTLGIGGLSADFTELDTHFLLRAGGGVRIFFTSFLAVRLEAIHDFVHSQGSRRAPAAGDWIGLTGLRAGVSLRF